MEIKTYFEELTADVVSFKSLPDLARFLLVNDDGTLGTCVCQKSVSAWPILKDFNAVQERSIDRGLLILKPEQRVIQIY